MKERLSLEKSVKRSVDRAEASYRRCWSILSDLKQGRPTDLLVELQPTLAEALFRLGRTYREVSEVRSTLIERKHRIKKLWFNKRQRTLAKQLTILTQAIAIGRGLGDCLAWFFYQQDRNHLLEHAKQPENAVLPGGIGGRGELEFIRRVRVLNRQIVLYHGITSILRLGDVSLIDPRNLRVAAIGELKTQRTSNPNELSTTFTFTGPQKRGKVGRVQKVRRLGEDLSAAVRERLRRQMRRINSAIHSSQERVPHFNLGGLDSGYIRTLGNLINASRGGGYHHAMAGPDLLLTVHRSRTRSLYARLSRKDPVEDLSRLGHLVRQLVLPESSFNRLLSGVLHYAGKGFGPHLLPGTIPMFWWELTAEELEPVLLGEVMVMTFYNPAHLARRLEQAGFEVMRKDDCHAGFFVRRPWKKGFLAFNSLDYFVGLSRFCLFSDSQVTKIIGDGLTKLATRKEVKPNVPVFWQFNHHLLRPGWKPRNIDSAPGLQAS